MSETSNDPIATLGQALEQRMLRELDAKPLEKFDQLLNLKNLAGENTGYVKAFTADKLNKGTSVSIDIMPGVRYFNIHIIPEPQYDVPRFLFEGMLMPQGSQVSMDLFPDVDAVAEIDALIGKYKSVGEIYEEVRTDDRFQLSPSRLMHMRAFSSPVFLLVFAVPPENLPALDSYAERYFDAWLEMYRNPRRLTDTEAEARRSRCEHIGKTIKRLDPDRHMVVNVYGEKTTCLIEDANMY
jgi:hypothetical protein